jgi:hypothetical protein
MSHSQFTSVSSKSLFGEISSSVAKIFSGNGSTRNFTTKAGYFYNYNVPYLLGSNKYLTNNMNSSNGRILNPGVDYVFGPPPQFISPGLKRTSLPPYITKDGSSPYRDSLGNKDITHFVGTNSSGEYYFKTTTDSGIMPSTGFSVTYNKIPINYEHYNLDPYIRDPLGNWDFLLKQDTPLNFDGTILTSDSVTLMNILVYYEMYYGYKYIVTPPDSAVPIIYADVYAWLKFSDFPSTPDNTITLLANDLTDVSQLFYIQTSTMYAFMAFGSKLKSLLNKAFNTEVSLDYLQKLTSDSNLNNWYSNFNNISTTDWTNEQGLWYGVQSGLCDYILFINLMLIFFNMNILDDNKPYGQGYQEFNSTSQITLKSGETNTFFSISTDSSSSNVFSNNSGYSVSSSSFLKNPGFNVNYFKNIVVVYSGMDDGGDKPSTVTVNLVGVDNFNSPLGTYSNPLAFEPDRLNLNYIVWIIPLNYPVKLSSMTVTAECNGSSCLINSYFITLVNN